MPELREALKEKLARENRLTGYDVMVTAGANQAFTNIQIALCDPGDSVVLFRPYYFNHMMAVQMTGGAATLELGPCHPDSMHPDFEWLRDRLAQRPTPKMVVLVNPCNPTGVLLSREELQAAADLCRDAGSWLVVDNTYEHFTYNGGEHHCIAGDHVIHIFSFSKAFGMMGWRMGYIGYPCSGSGPDRLGLELLKVQDTVPICPPQLSQLVALGAVKAGRSWVKERVTELEPNRQAIIDALSPLGNLGEGIAGGEGAIYFWAQLPSGFHNDEAVVEWLVREQGVCVIPGTACGVPGCIRVSYANVNEVDCRLAASRLKAGLQQLVEHGPSVLENA